MSRWISSQKLILSRRFLHPAWCVHARGGTHSYLTFKHFHYRPALKVTLNVECLFECFYQVICMYPQPLSFLADRLDSDCSPGVMLPASRPSSEQCRTSLPCLVLKHVKSANVFCPYQFTLLLFNAFSHASPITVCLLLFRDCAMHTK